MAIESSPVPYGEQVGLNVLDVELHSNKPVVINDRLGLAFVRDPRGSALLVIREKRQKLTIQRQGRDPRITPAESGNENLAGKMIPLQEILVRVIIGEGEYFLTPIGVITPKVQRLIVRVESPRELVRGRIGEIDRRDLQRTMRDSILI